MADVCSAGSLRLLCSPASSLLAPTACPHSLLRQGTADCLIASAFFPCLPCREAGTHPEGWPGPDFRKPRCALRPVLLLVLLFVPPPLCVNPVPPPTGGVVLLPPRTQLLCCHSGMLEVLASSCHCCLSCPCLQLTMIVYGQNEALLWAKRVATFQQAMRCAAPRDVWQRRAGSMVQPRVPPVVGRQRATGQ